MSGNSPLPPYGMTHTPPPYKGYPLPAYPGCFDDQEIDTSLIDTSMNDTSINGCQTIRRLMFKVPTNDTATIRRLMFKAPTFVRQTIRRLMFKAPTNDTSMIDTSTSEHQDIRPSPLRPPTNH